VAVVESADAEAFEEPIAPFEMHAGSSSDGGMAEGGGEKGLAFR
jgi:hypothetical protein